MRTSCNTFRNIVDDSPSSLFQIRTTFTSRWNGFVFFVEAGSGEWTLRVQEEASCRILYRAHRRTEAEAKTACMEFAIFCSAGMDSRLQPEVAVSELKWSSYCQAAA